VRRVH